ncbi:MAG: nicotinamide-nucleotide amidohydrolase family protein [Planctomycetota bacterium]|nr:nicotinamide-nucleotide amidohydrolase family protein [Planctomycetota bacterium]
MKALAGRGLTLALAESCTAGLVAAALGEVPGLSKTFLEGAVTYSNEAKTRACGVKPETLKAHGAVSAETAAELAEGIRKRAGADIGLSVTGIAGPDGGTDEKPVGLVFFGIATPAGVTVERRVMAGQERNVFRERAMMLALDFIRRAALGNAPSGS